MAEKKKEPSMFDNTLQYVKPFVSILPQIRNPMRNPSFREKFIWTALAILVYLVASQVPLFGIINTSSKDPLGWMRMMMASNRGTIMDLGVSPVVTSSMVMQFLTTTGIVNPDWSVKEDKILFESLQKLIALIMTVGQSIVQIATGYYGAPKEIGFCYCSILLIQLIIAGIIVILLDEMLQKGYGLGNGVNLFIATNVCERIIWNAFSPKVFYTGRGLEFEGCFVAFFHLLIARRNKFAAVYEVFFRENLPNMFSFLATILMFCFVVYIQAIRVELPIVSRKYKGLVNTFPIPLLYTSTMPVIVQGYIVSHTSTISRFLYTYYPNNFIVKILGVWEVKPSLGSFPVSGICYYIYPPSSFSDAFSRPIFFTIYLLITLLSAAFISKGWLEAHEDNAEAVFNKLKNQEMQLKGTNDSMAVQKLNEYIPVAAFLGGLLTSAVIVLCDISSTVGSGNNIFLAASIIHQYIKLMTKESVKRSGKAVIN